MPYVQGLQITQSPSPKPPPARHLAQAELADEVERPLLRIFSLSWIMPVEMIGRDSTSSTRSGNFELARRSLSRRSIWFL